MILDLANIGPELRDLRELRGLSRVGLARRIAANTGGNARTLESQLWAWETGKTEPTPSTVAAILTALDYRTEVRAVPPTPARRPLLDAPCPAEDRGNLLLHEACLTAAMRGHHADARPFAPIPVRDPDIRGWQHSPIDITATVPGGGPGIRTYRGEPAA